MATKVRQAMFTGGPELIGLKGAAASMTNASWVAIFKAWA